MNNTWHSPLIEHFCLWWNFGIRITIELRKKNYKKFDVVNRRHRKEFDRKIGTLNIYVRIIRHYHWLHTSSQNRNKLNQGTFGCVKWDLSGTCNVNVTVAAGLDCATGVASMLPKLWTLSHNGCLITAENERQHMVKNSNEPRRSSGSRDVLFHWETQTERNNQTARDRVKERERAQLSSRLRVKMGIRRMTQQEWCMNPGLISHLHRKRKSSMMYLKRRY